MYQCRPWRAPKGANSNFGPKPEYAGPHGRRRRISRKSLCCSGFCGSGIHLRPGRLTRQRIKALTAKSWAVIEGVNELESGNIPLLEKGINILDASCGRANSPPQLRRGGRDIK